MDKFTVGVVCVLIVVLALPLLVSFASHPKTVATPPPSASAPEAVPVAAPPPPPGSAPMIVSTTPAIGAANVDPRLTEIRVTFNTTMAGGFSWTGGGENFPSSPPGAKAHWLPDRKTCVLPVALRPNWSYQFGLNSQSFRNFRSADGTPLNPVVFTFSTKAG